MEQVEKYNEIQIVGMPWFRPEVYDSARALCQDCDELPPKFADWLEKAEDRRRQLVEQGFTVICENIEPTWFPDWCRRDKVELGYAAMVRMAEESANEALICELRRRAEEEYQKSIGNIIKKKVKIRNILAKACENTREMLDRLNDDLDRNEQEIRRLKEKIRERNTAEDVVVPEGTMQWFRRHEYERIRSLCKDGDKFPATYDEWRNIALQNLKKIDREGSYVHPCRIDPDMFIWWCKSEGIEPDYDATMDFVIYHADLMERVAELKPPAGAGHEIVMAALEKAAFEGVQNGTYFSQTKEKARRDAQRKKREEREKNKP
ncbi:MAG: hypothetical protein LBC63_03165 [Holophagales bacterium]|nr:hypothetical protein [Holophagales bacterium]